MATSFSARFEPLDSGVVDQIVHRSLVSLCRGGAAIQDQIDCADLLVATGYEAEARTIMNLVALRRGALPGEGSPPAGDFSFEPAIAELAGLMRVAGAVPASQDDFSTHSGSGRADPAAAALCDRLVAALSRPAGAEASRDLATILSEIRTAVVERPDEPNDLLVVPLPDLVAHAVITGLRDWVLAHHDLCYPPAGSGALLHAAARCHPGGLGPCLDGVPLLLRSSRDVFALVRLALERAGMPEDDAAIERWSGLLALTFDPSTQLDIIDDLGDRGMDRALRQVLADIVRAPNRPLEREMLWRIRDAGIDNHDFGLATAAQQRLATRDAHSRIEWMVLGEVQASGGDFDGAERSLRTALALEPGDASTTQRLDAVLARDFAGFAIRNGFGSSRDRVLHRTARLERLAASRETDS